jgi:hypothetical protein
MVMTMKAVGEAEAKTSKERSRTKAKDFISARRTPRPEAHAWSIPSASRPDAWLIAR